MPASTQIPVALDYMLAQLEERLQIEIPSLVREQIILSTYQHVIRSYDDMVRLMEVETKGNA